MPRNRPQNKSVPKRMILPTTAWGSTRLAVVQNRDLMKPANTAFFRSNDSRLRSSRSVDIELSTLMWLGTPYREQPSSSGPPSSTCRLQPCRGSGGSPLKNWLYAPFSAADTRQSAIEEPRIGARRNGAAVRSRDSRSRMAQAAGLFPLRESRYGYGGDRRAT